MSRIALKSLVLRLFAFAALLGTAHMLAVFLAANANAKTQALICRYTNIPVGLARQGSNSLLRFRELQNVRNVDVAFIGSSHAYRSFDPRFFARHGVRTFNLGSSSQTPLNSFYLLSWYWEALKPKLLVVEVYWEVFGKTGLESVLDFAASLPLSARLWQVALATADIRAVNALLAKALSLGGDPAETFTPLPARDTYISGGYVETAAGFRNAPAKLVPRPHRIVVNPEQFEYLARMIAMAQHKQVAVVLVFQPLPSPSRAAILNAEEVRSQLARVAKKFQIPYLEFDGLLKLDDVEDFIDRDHLSQKGVQKFDRVLYAELMRLDLIPDKTSPSE